MPYYQRNLYVLCLSNFLAATSWTQLLPFLPLFLIELGVEERVSEWSGLVFGIHFFAGIILTPVWGKIADRVGRKAMTVRAGISIGIIYFLTGMSTEPWHLVVLRFINGALAGFVPMSAALLASNTPKDLAGRYLALLQTSHASGTIVGPLVGGVLASLFGIRGAFYVSGTALLLTTLLILLLVEERHRPDRTNASSSMLADVRAAFASPALLLSMFLSLMASIGSVGTQPLLALHMENLVANPEPWMTGLVFTLPGVGIVATATHWVRLFRTRGVRWVATVSLLGTGAFGVMAGLAGNVLAFGAAFFGMALFLAALRPVSSALISAEVDPAFHGRAFGLQHSAFTLGGLIGPVSAGAIAGFAGNKMAFVAIGVAFLLSPLAVLRYVGRVGGKGTGGAPPAGSRDALHSTRDALREDSPGGS